MRHQTPFRTRASRVMGVLLVTALAACSDGNLIGPDNQLEVSNNADSFSFQVTALDNVTQTLTYPWTITGPDATVNIAGAVTAGTATVTISDADGNEVFTRSLDGSSNPSTDSGTVGDWTITIDLVGVSGTLNFSVQKKP